MKRKNERFRNLRYTTIATAIGGGFRSKDADNGTRKDR